MRSKRMRKYRKQFRHVILVGKMVFIWYLIVFAVSYVTTSDTTAGFTDLQKVGGMIYAAGDWKVVDESAFTFTGKEKQEINTCDPKIIKAQLKNDGAEDMHDSSTYDVYFSENGDPKTDGKKMKLAREDGSIPEIEKGESFKLTFNVTKPGNYMFVAYQLDKEQTEVWSEEIVVTCASERKQDTEKTSDSASESTVDNKEHSEETKETTNETDESEKDKSGTTSEENEDNAESSKSDDANDSDKANSMDHDDVVNEEDSTHSTDKKGKDDNGLVNQEGENDEEK